MAGKNADRKKYKGQEVLGMFINQKTVKVLNKIFEAGFTTEKDISAMTMIFYPCRVLRLRKSV